MQKDHSVEDLIAPLCVCVCNEGDQEELLSRASGVYQVVKEDIHTRV